MPDASATVAPSGTPALSISIQALSTASDRAVDSLLIDVRTLAPEIRAALRHRRVVNYDQDWWHYSYAVPNARRFDGVIH